MKIRNCNFEIHGRAVLEIFNREIETSSSIYEYLPFSTEKLKDWFTKKQDRNFPIIAAIDDFGKLTGYATYGVFRDRPAYRYTVEHSVYVHEAYRGSGIGKSLLEKLIYLAEEQDYHILIGGIDAGNLRSIVLHQKLGFIPAGKIQEVGYKFGQWLTWYFIRKF